MSFRKTMQRYNFLTPMSSIIAIQYAILSAIQNRIGLNMTRKAATYIPNTRLTLALVTSATTSSLTP